MCDSRKKLKTKGMCEICGSEVSIIDFTHWMYLQEWWETGVCEVCNIKMNGRVSEDES